MSYPVSFKIDFPEKLSRGVLLLRIFFGWLYVGIPHGICLFLYGILVAIVQFLAFWAVLFAGRYPKGMFDFTVGYMRWTNNVAAYMSFKTDVYPPFSGKEQ